MKLALTLLTICIAVAVQAQFTDSTLRADTVFTFRDSRDGKDYEAIRIGNQIWMAENLRFKAKDSWCYDINGSCKKYGRLYTWQEAQTACPKGWHIPGMAEWQTLIDYCGGDKLAGKPLTYSEYLDFQIVFGYPPNINGRYSAEGTQAHFWTADEYNANTGWVYYFIYDKLPLVYTNYFSKNYSMMCRCVKDSDEVSEKP